MTVDIDVAVLGAGPHGLSAAIHLRRAGVAALSFGRPMSFWKQMPAGMKLRSNMSATNLVEPGGPWSLASYLEELGEQQGWPVPLERFTRYGEWVQERAVPDLDPRMIRRVERRGTHFTLELDDGALVTARRVVVAAGIRSFEYLPTGFAALGPDRVFHTGRHSDLGAFADRSVLVVGGGQSAFECAALMRERGARRVEVLVRRAEIVWLRGRSWKTRLGPLGPIVYAPTDVGPLWYSRLVATPALFRRVPRTTQTKVAHRSIRPACSHFVKVRLDGVTVTCDVAVTGAEPADAGVTVRLSDGSSRHVDHLMFGTGYRVDISRYGFLGDTVLTRLRLADGYPVLGRGLESAVPGLHFVGAPAAWSFGPVMRFVSGSWYAGRAVARAVSEGSPMGRPVRAGAAR